MIYLPKIYNSDLSLNYEELDKLLARIEKKLDEREFGDFERDVLHLALAVSKLKDEKDAWEEMYRNLADRYLKYLDKTTEKMKKMLGKT